MLCPYLHVQVIDPICKVQTGLPCFALFCPDTTENEEIDLLIFEILIFLHVK